MGVVCASWEAAGHAGRAPLLVRARWGAGVGRERAEREVVPLVSCACEVPG